MKIVLAILVITSCACLCEGTLKHLKTKLKLSPFTQPSARYKYVPSRVVLSKPVPVVYSSATVSHYAPSYPVYEFPVYPAPVVYSSLAAVPVPFYEKPLAIYEESPVIHYEEPAAISLEASVLNEGHYVETWDK